MARLQVSLIVVVILLVSSLVGAGSVLQLSDATFSEYRSAHQFLFVKFFAPWCGHCKRMASDWRELANENHGVTIAEVDCTVDTGLCSEMGVSGYPTILWFSGTTAEPIEHTGGRTLQAFSHFISMQKAAAKTGGGEVALPAEEGGLLSLASENFDGAIRDGFSFVKFYAPWCGHCKRMAGSWLELAKSYEEVEDVTIAEVDCTQNSDKCHEMGVKGYPTLLAFTDGNEVEKYEGRRDVQSFAAFVERLRHNKDDTPEDNMETDLQQADEGEAQDFADNGGEVMSLTSQTFSSAVASGTCFVKFYAPWCGHCKQLAPVWADLAIDVEESPELKVAEVDCTVNENLCRAHDIKGYPSMLLFQDGQQIDTYTGSRDVASLVAYLRSHSKGHDEL